MLRSWTE